MQSTAVFLRAAKRRRSAADVLVRHAPPFRTDAVYLAGYAGERALKALLIHATPAGGRAQLIAEVFRGNRGHDIQLLTRILADRGVSWTRAIHSDLQRLAGWSTRLRYETGESPEQPTKEFLGSVDRVLKWVEDKT